MMNVKKRIASFNENFVTDRIADIIEDKIMEDLGLQNKETNEKDNATARRT